MKIAYFDCFAGAGGDMIVATMLDAGLDGEFLKEQLSTLDLGQVDIQISETKRGSLSAKSFLPKAGKQHAHRNLSQIVEIIDNSGISESAKERAKAIFTKLAQAEGLVHGKDANEIHFHEVGAVDSIIDIVSAAIGIEALGVEKVYCSALSVGGGTVKCAHGTLPVPAPATSELLKGVPIVGGPVDVELLTPTAAAILTNIVDEFGQVPSMEIEKIGYGAGTYESSDFPNVLRLFLGEAAATGGESDVICLLETNIDDATGELIGHLMDRLFESGALDVFSEPIRMKQNRPAVKLSVICEIGDIEQIEQRIFGEGVTFGIRKQLLNRSKLNREFVTVETKFGQIKVKVGMLGDRVVNAKPEFSDCQRAAEKNSVAVKIVMEAAMTAYRESK
ncbi:MAG: nickel pincer cofactor biosynthesis protein LarC [Planctomycetes bacterium]|nr:nickel pincer cofactor biosynthesis protein LarC [Planctomycetota bacterium]